jgi:hypothetical protein
MIVIIVHKLRHAALKAAVARSRSRRLLRWRARRLASRPLVDATARSPRQALETAARASYCTSSGATVRMQHHRCVPCIAGEQGAGIDDFTFEARVHPPALSAVVYERCSWCTGCLPQLEQVDCAPRVRHSASVANDRDP